MSRKPFKRRVRSSVQSLVRGLGWQLTKLPTGAEYEPILPQAQYAPWNADPAFEQVYATIKGRTLVDVYRCWELWTLVDQTARLGGSIIEVGVWRGGTGALMAKRLVLSGSTKPIYLCDTFTGVVKAGAQDSVYKGGEHADTSAAVVTGLLKELGVANGRILQGIFPEDTAGQVPATERFGLCHIDVDVYQSASDVFDWVWDKLLPGGVVVFDDYGFEQCRGIRKFVDEQRGKRDRLVMHNLNGHGLVLKLG
jgi:O-methyltransferase